MLLLNSHTLYVADDYVYRFVYQSPSPTAFTHQPLITTWLIPESMWNHYQLWNGRFVAHSIVQYFMQFNSKVPFNICSSFIYVLMLVFMDKLSVKLSGTKANPIMLILLFLFTWFYIPYFGQSVLWLSGSGNYLWMSIIYLGFIIFNLKVQTIDFVHLLGAALLGFLAGATNENSGPAAVLIVLLFMLRRLIKEHKLSLVSFVSVVFSGIGFITMMSSPGSQKRGDIHRTWALIQKNFAGIYQLTIKQWVWIYLAIAILLIVGIVMRRIQADTFWAVIFFVIGHLAAVYAMAFSPEYPERTFFGGVLFLGIALFITIYAIFSQWQWGLSGAAIIVSVLFMFSFVPAFHDINLSYQQMQTEYRLIYQAKAAGKDSVKVPLMTPQKSKYNANYGVIALDTPATALMNQWEAKFFDLKAISGYRVK